MTAPIEFYILLRDAADEIIGVTKVSMEDAAPLSRWRWRLNKTGRSEYVYVARTEGGKCILMHRQLAGTPRGMVTDHKNGDGLDNRRCNLRNATYRQNQYNRRVRRVSRSTSKGVDFMRKKQKWRARITSASGERKFLGLFDTEQQAASAYNAVCLQEHGEFARPNA